MDRTNPICVERSKNPNALESIIDPESGTLERELKRVEEQASYMKTRFNVVKSKFPLPQRQLLADAQAMELGEQFSARKTEVIEAQNRKRQQHSQAHRFLQETGIAVPDPAKTALAPEDARFLRDFLKEKDTP